MDPVAHHYPSTILRFDARPPFEVDLRRPLGTRTLFTLRRLGLGARFGIVTAHNPGGRRVPAATNRRRLTRLAAQLTQGGRTCLPADGWSTDRRHRERGFAIGAPRAALVALARRFGQTAIFWFDGRRFLLVWCARPARGLPLPATTR
jgi:hypothetical protein